MATTKRKRNTALVFNPSRSLSIGGAKPTANPRRRKRATHHRHHHRRNPVALKTAGRKRNPARRRANPASTSGLVIGAIMAGVGVSLFDVVATRFAPQSSGLIRAGVKLGGAYAFQTFGGKVPVLGKYKNEIALVLATAGMVDLMKIYVLPVVAQTLNQIGLTGVSAALLPAPATTTAVAGGDQTTGNIYGNSPARWAGQYY
jgi:hypothetical protein